MLSYDYRGDTSAVGRPLGLREDCSIINGNVNSLLDMTAHEDVPYLITILTYPV